MSYCRWSSDDYQCDVYVWEHMDGDVVVNVASCRHDLDSSPHQAERPAPVDIKKDGVEEYVLRHAEFMKFLETCTVKPIGLAHDGESRTFEDKNEAADYLQALKLLGYNVPGQVIDTLREEAADEDVS